jgi:hypothetical protein
MIEIRTIEIRELILPCQHRIRGSNRDAGQQFENEFGQKN